MERKQARTDGEREEEEEEVVEMVEEDDDDDDVPYNPKNLPLGWDGKVRNKIYKRLPQQYGQRQKYSLGSPFLAGPMP